MNIGKSLSTLGKSTTDPNALARGTNEGASPLDDIDENPLGISDKGAEEAKEWDEDLTTRGQEGPKHVGHYAADVLRSPLAALGGLAESAWDAADWLTGDDMLPDWDRGHGSWGENWFDKSATLPGGLVEGFLQFATFFIPGTWALGAAKAAKAAKIGKGAFGKSTAKQAAQMVANNTVKGKKNFNTKQMKLLKGLKKNSRAFAEMSAIGAVSDLMAFKGQEFRLSNLLTKMGGDDSPDMIKWLAHDPNEPEEWHSEIMGRLKNMIEGFFVGSALVGGVAAGKGMFKLMNRHPAAAKNAQDRAARGEQPNPAEDAAKAIKDNPVTAEQAKALIQAKFRLQIEAENAGIPQAVKDKAAEQSSPFQPWQKRIDPVLRPKTRGRSSYASEDSARKAVERVHKKDPDEYTYLPDEDGGVVPVLTEELERLGLARPRSAEELAGIEREVETLAESGLGIEREAGDLVPFKDTEEYFQLSRGGILHPDKGRIKNADLYEGFEEGMFGGGGPINEIHRKIFSPTGRTPDVIAQDWGGAGLIPGKDAQSATAEDFWEHLGKLYQRGKKIEELKAKEKELGQELTLKERQRRPDVEKDLTYKKFKETQEHTRKLEGEEGLEPSPEFWWMKPREEGGDGGTVVTLPSGERVFRPTQRQTLPGGETPRIERKTEPIPDKPPRPSLNDENAHKWRGPVGPDKLAQAQRKWDSSYKETHNADGTPKATAEPEVAVTRAEPEAAPPGRDEPSSEPKSWNEDELDNFLKSRDVLPTHMMRDQKVRVTEEILTGKITESQIATLKEAAEKILKDAGGYDKTNPRAVYSGARAAGDQAELASTFMVIAAASLKKIRAEAPPRSATQQIKLEYQQHQAREAQEMADLMSGAIGGEPRRLNLEHFEGRADELAMFRADQMTLFDGFVDAGRHVSEKFHKFEKAVDESAAKGLDAVEKARAELYSAMDYHLNVEKLLARFGTEYSQGMSLRYLMFHGDTYTGSFRPVPIRKIGFETPTEFALKADFAARDALHHGFRGGKSEKAVMKSIRKAVAHDDPIERATALAKLLPSERNLMAMTQEWYLNALLGSPVTWTVNLTSNFAVMALGHFKLTTGALLTGNKDLLKANISAMFDVQNFVEALKFAKLSLKTGESRSVSGHTAYHDNRIDLSGHFKAEKLGVPKMRKVTDKEGNVTMEPNGYYEAIEFLGSAIRHPQRIMLAGDEFFKQWNFRARTKTMLGMEAYEKGITDPKAWAKHVEEGFEGLITKEGRFRNEGNVMKEATEQAEKRGLVGRERTKAISKYMDRHYRNNDIILEGPEGKMYDRNDFYARRALVEDGTDWALVQTFTNNPRNALTRNLSKLATFSPWLTFVIPFVRTPANILTYALSHTVPIGRPTRIHKAGIAGALQRKKAAPTEAELAPLRELYEDMGSTTPQADAMARKYHDLLRRGNSVEAAEYLGRLSTAGMAVGGIFMYVEGIKENITGSSPQGGPDREAWKIAGKQPYSIKLGDKWVSYQRMDPFATMLGIFVDIVHGFDRARLKERGIFGGEDDIEENATVFKKVVGVMAMSMANNLTKKSYVENLASFFDLLRRPTQTGPQLGGNILGGFVPNALNVSQNIYQEDPAILESRKLLDKFMQKLGPLRPDIGETLLTTGKPMPQRNFLGEIRRKQNLGGLKGLAPFFSSDVSIDSVDLELEALQQGRANMSPMLTVDGSRRLNLRDYIDASGNTAFDRMQELSSAGDTSIRGSKTLRQALRMLIESRGYQSLPDITDNNLGPDHPRNKAISGVMGTYRARAKRQIFKEFPELKADYVRMLQANPY